VGNALVGFIEVKAPGNGADPHKFTDPHEPANRVGVLLVNSAVRSLVGTGRYQGCEESHGWWKENAKSESLNAQRNLPEILAKNMQRADAGSFGSRLRHHLRHLSSVE
jgi:hypothetical protein